MKSFKQFKEEKEKEELKNNDRVAKAIKMGNAAGSLPLSSRKERNERRKDNIPSKYYKGK
jgi:hypothetical protein